MLKASIITITLLWELYSIMKRKSFFFKYLVKVWLFSSDLWSVLPSVPSVSEKKTHKNVKCLINFYFKSYTFTVEENITQYICIMPDHLIWIKILSCASSQKGFKLAVYIRWQLRQVWLQLFFNKMKVTKIINYFFL